MHRKNIQKILEQASEIDIREGKMAFRNYHNLLKNISEYYQVGFTGTVAAFSSLSPNQSYLLNLRSLISLIIGVKENKKLENIRVSGYRHCLNRAHQYLIGEKDFLLETKGPKIRNFYCSILLPFDKRFITIDGHMFCIWKNKRETMKTVAISGFEYEKVANDFKKVAKANNLIPNQLQAILWFTWKRINNIVYSPQVRIGGEDDTWGLKLSIEDIKPFEHQKEDIECLNT